MEFYLGHTSDESDRADLTNSVQHAHGLSLEIDSVVRCILSDSYTLDRLRTRIYLLFVAGLLLPKENKGSFNFLATVKSNLEAQKLASEFIRAYASQLILEERIQGNLEAFEGIRILKERKKI